MKFKKLRTMLALLTFTTLPLVAIACSTSSTTRPKEPSKEATKEPTEATPKDTSEKTKKDESQNNASTDLTIPDEELKIVGLAATQIAPKENDFQFNSQEITDKSFAPSYKLGVKQLSSRSTRFIVARHVAYDLKYKKAAGSIAAFVTIWENPNSSSGKGISFHQNNIFPSTYEGNVGRFDIQLSSLEADKLIHQAVTKKTANLVKGFIAAQSQIPPEKRSTYQLIKDGNFKEVFIPFEDIQMSSLSRLQVTTRRKLQESLNAANLSLEILSANHYFEDFQSAQDFRDKSKVSWSLTSDELSKDELQIIIIRVTLQETEGSIKVEYKLQKDGIESVLKTLSVSGFSHSPEAASSSSDNGESAPSDASGSSSDNGESAPADASGSSSDNEESAPADASGSSSDNGESAPAEMPESTTIDESVLINLHEPGATPTGDDYIYSLDELLAELSSLESKDLVLPKLPKYSILDVNENVKDLSPSGVAIVVPKYVNYVGKKYQLKEDAIASFIRIQPNTQNQNGFSFTQYSLFLSTYNGRLRSGDKKLTSAEADAFLLKALGENSHSLTKVFLSRSKPPKSSIAENIPALEAYRSHFFISKNDLTITFERRG